MTGTEDKAQPNDLAEQFGVVRAELARLASMIGDAASEKAHAASERAARMADEAKEQTAAFQTRAGQTYESGKEAVRRNPALAVGLSVGAGILLSRHLRRRRF